METEDKKTTDQYPEWSANRSGRVSSGLFIVVIGGLLLARQMGAEIPDWIFTWPSLLIAIGFYVGLRHSFRSFGWLIPVAIGSFLLSREYFDLNVMQYFWPVIIILIGVAIMFKPRRRWHHERWARKQERWKQRWERQHEMHQQQYHQGQPLEGDAIDSVNIFGGTKKNVISKDFKGGESVNMFGGLELNMSQADITGRVSLEVVQIFGGTKLVVPAHWKIIADDLVTVFGSIEDKRVIQPGQVDETKILILQGTCVFGGIEIKSF